MGSKRAAASGESGRVSGRGVVLPARASKAEMRACTSLIVVWRASAVGGTAQRVPQLGARLGRWAESARRR